MTDATFKDLFSRQNTKLEDLEKELEQQEDKNQILNESISFYTRVVYMLIVVMIFMTWVNMQGGWEHASKIILPYISV